MSAANEILEDNRLTLLLGLSLAFVVIATQIKTIRRALGVVYARLHLQLLINRGKATGGEDKLSEAENDTAVVTGLYRHPVKSLKLVPMQQAVLDVKGFVGDRQYMIVVPLPLPIWGSFEPNDATYRFLTQRQCPILSQISVHLNETKKTLDFVYGNKTMSISTEPNKDSPKILARLWEESVTVQDMGG
jgi:MOSC N-terminal beta barrel domain